MKPMFEITANDKDITAVISDRFVELSIVDDAGFESDSLEIVLDNRDLAIEPPARGVELKVALGHRETGLAEMGLFVVDEYERSGLPHLLTVRARSAFGGDGSKSETLNGIKTALKQQSTRSWDQVTLKQLVEQIATECGLKARVALALEAVVLEHVDQMQESNRHFLQRLARDRDLLFKAAGGFLIFAPKGKAGSALRSTLPVVQLTLKTQLPGAKLWTQVTSYRLTVAEREKYQSVKARYHDFEAAQQIDVCVGNGDPVKELRKLYGSEEEAANAAEAELQRMGRGNAAPTFAAMGNVALMAEGIVEVDESMGRDLQGGWLVSRVTHRLSRSGFSTNIECEGIKS